MSADILTNSVFIDDLKLLKDLIERVLAGQKEGLTGKQLLTTLDMITMRTIHCAVDLRQSGHG